MFYALRNSLMSPSEQRCQKDRGSCTMGTQHSNIGGGKVRSTETNRRVGFLGVFEQDESRLFGLEEPLMRRYGHGVSRLYASK